MCLLPGLKQIKQKWYRFLDIDIFHHLKYLEAATILLYSQIWHFQLFLSDSVWDSAQAAFLFPENPESAAVNLSNSLRYEPGLVSLK